ncbi:MAG: hypothetical protein L0I76_24525 [Pseudonocardia sp.]|nr:hypothetical protein [Pseudonocardia sp.]
MSATQLRVSRSVNAPARQIFDLLADPSRHTEIDGSGMLRGVAGVAGPVTGVGEQFFMEMFQDALGDYQMANKIVAFERDRLIGWQPRMERAPKSAPDMVGHGPRGQTYTYELTAAKDGTTVTQVYDWSAVTSPEIVALMPRVTEAQLLDTLDRLAVVVGG